MSTEHRSNTPPEIRDLWQTPKFVFDYYDRRFGFNVDMAASKENKLCDYYMSEKFSALQEENFTETLNELFSEHHAHGVIWCNPPYSHLMPWVSSVIEYSKRFMVPIVMLIPADTSVKWFKLAFENCTECHFISGRLSFISAETQQPVSGNNKGSVVFIFDPTSPVKQFVQLIDRDSMKG